jgi:hypothetical protein
VPPPFVAAACSPNPCKNGGKCSGSNTSFTCTCSAGFLGEDCSEEKPADSKPSSGGEISVLFAIQMIILALFVIIGIVEKVSAAPYTDKNLFEDRYSRYDLLKKV